MPGDQKKDKKNAHYKHAFQKDEWSKLICSPKFFSSKKAGLSANSDFLVKRDEKLEFFRIKCESHNQVIAAARENQERYQNP